MATRPRRKTPHIKIDRSTLSPFAEAALMQLLPELYKNSENKKQAITKLQNFKRAVQTVINRVKSEKWQPKPPQKRSPRQEEKRRAWFEQKRRERIDEPKTKQQIEDEMPEKTLEQFIEDNRAKPLVKPAAPAPAKPKTWYELQTHDDIERAAARGEKWAIEQLEDEE